MWDIKSIETQSAWFRELNHLPKINYEYMCKLLDFRYPKPN